MAVFCVLEHPTLLWALEHPTHPHTHPNWVCGAVSTRATFCTDGRTGDWVVVQGAVLFMQSTWVFLVPSWMWRCFFCNTGSYFLRLHFLKEGSIYKTFIE